MDGDSLCLALKKRKNKPWGSLLKRGCWCKTNRLTCPVHHLWPFFQSLPVGTRPFAIFSPGKALACLRWLLKTLGVADAGKFRTHDLRRGHTKDMQQNGSTLGEILAAGEWRGPSFMSYIDLTELEMAACMEAHDLESSSEDESDDDLKA